MTITFKDVGQGDSILIEWYDRFGKLQIGIIDCNKKGVSNPIVDYVNSLRDFDFIFILLSHPHDDHFSGMLELLETIQNKNISLKYFLHTCWSQKEYLTYSVRANTSKKLLTKIFKKADELYELNQIINYGFVNDLTTEIELEPTVFLKFLYPNHKFISQFNRVAFKNQQLLNNNPDANLLCTVCKIYSSKRWSLLTADAVRDVFWDMNRKGYSQFKIDLVGAQIPHHGSEINYYETFWRLLKHNEHTQACISVGNNSYGHPNQKVLSSLRNLNYIVRMTSTNTATASSNSSSLDLISEVVGYSGTSNDITIAL